MPATDRKAAKARQRAAQNRIAAGVRRVVDELLALLEVEGATDADRTVWTLQARRAADLLDFVSRRATCRGAEGPRAVERDLLLGVADADDRVAAATLEVAVRAEELLAERGTAQALARAVSAMQRAERRRDALLGAWAGLRATTREAASA